MFIKLIQSRQMDHFIADILELKSFLHFSVKINGRHYRDGRRMLWTGEEGTRH